MEKSDIIQEKNIKNFNKLGGFKMAEYKSSKSDFEAEKEQVLNKLNEIEKKYSLEEFQPKEITSLGLEKKEFNAPTQEEIKQQAENSLKAEKENGIKKIQNTYEKKFSDLDYKFETLDENKIDDLETASRNYVSSLKNATNNSIKQGISRSSIYNEALKAIESNFDETENKIISEFNKNLTRLEGEKEILQKQKESALESFDISYAVKLETKISNLNKEILKQQQEVEKFNKEIDEKEQKNIEAQEKANLEEQKRIEKRNAEILKQKEKNGAEFTREKFKEKYDVVLEFLMSLPKDVALNELTKDNSYEMMLSMYYPAVYAQIAKRKE